MNLAVAIMIATGALKLKRATFRETSEGVEIGQPGKPTLLLTFEEARRFAQHIEEVGNE